jgi:uncharacterized protein
VRLAEPTRAGEVTQAAVTASGDAARVHGLGLVVGDPAAALAAARELAWRDARARAEQYAALAGTTLGRVLRIDETAGESHGPHFQAAARYVAESAAPAVPVGETPLWVAATATWTLEDAAPLDARSDPGMGL